MDICVLDLDQPKNDDIDEVICEEQLGLTYKNTDDVETDLIPSFSAHEETAVLQSGWGGGIREVEQKFERGAEEFRRVLCKYAIQLGFNFKYVKNNKDRVTTQCCLCEETGCMWYVHASKEKANGFFFYI